MLGTVTILRRYPVKSMLGEDLDAAEVSRSGLARDRRLAVVSRRTGKVASAKYPRLWRDMLTLSAEALDDATARITLPGGKTVSSTDPGVDEILSGLLGQPVTLFYDASGELLDTWTGPLTREALQSRLDTILA